MVDMATVRSPSAAACSPSLLATLAAVLDLRRRRASTRSSARRRSRGWRADRAAAPRGRCSSVGCCDRPSPRSSRVLAPRRRSSRRCCSRSRRCCLIPLAFARLRGRSIASAAGMRGSMLAVAVMEVRATSMRSIALAAVAAVAVFGSVAIEGRAPRPRARPRRQLRASTSALRTCGSTTGGDDLTTNAFAAGDDAGAARETARDRRRPPLPRRPARRRRPARCGSSPARAPTTRSMHPVRASCSHGDLATASARIAAAWLGCDLGRLRAQPRLRVGDEFTLPTPSGGDACASPRSPPTSAGRQDGVILNATDYAASGRRATRRRCRRPRAGDRPLAGKRAVEQVLGSGDRPARPDAGRAPHPVASLSRQGLTSLSQISILLLVAAAIAVAVGARRDASGSGGPDSPRCESRASTHRQLWRALMIEGGIVLSIGCAIGVRSASTGTRWPTASCVDDRLPGAVLDRRRLALLTFDARRRIAARDLPGYRAGQRPEFRTHELPGVSPKGRRVCRQLSRMAPTSGRRSPAA